MPDHSVPRTLPFEPCHRQGHESSQKECIFCAQEYPMAKIGKYLLLGIGLVGSLMLLLLLLGGS
jgi:hypothetical protein